MLYESVIFIGSVIARFIALFDKKMARFFSLREKETERIADYFSSYQNQKNKVIWFHASSAGELEQAKPLIEHFKRTIKKAQIIASFFSPSGYDAGLKYKQIDFCFNLPLDYTKNAEALLNCINPEIIIFSKYDVWTNLTVEARRRNVKLALISATLPEKSLRHKFPLSSFFSKAYSALDRIYAISKADADRFSKIAKNKHSIKISGDTRFDRIKTVIDNAQVNTKSIIKKQKDIDYLVAGSTYEVCEKKLIGVLKQLNENYKNIRLILVPHEIDAGNILRLNKLVSSYGYNPVMYSKAVHPVLLNDNDVLIIDAFGVLAFLYREADIVFVGGSYKGSVHSVLEPAIFGKTILTGPYIQNSYEALELNLAGGLLVCKDQDELFKQTSDLIRDKSYRNKIAQKAKIFFEKNTGATNIILKDIRKLL
ncbi:MAG: glycosyltransferase N-terminal domain-containing protein [Spirochaetota bacterium]